MPTTIREAEPSNILSRITCPHCWDRFSPEDIKWVSVHPDLLGDDKLGSGANLRFYPSRFNVDGLGIDVRGQVCRELACPKCHLLITKASLELPPSIVSIIGSPGSGKSYFLASMLWQARKTFAENFDLSFADADLKSNAIVNDYEEKLFLQDNPDQYVQILKTQLQGDLYDGVNFDDYRTIMFSKPFLYTVKPHAHHPIAGTLNRISRLLVIYDNAGEHFLPDNNRPDEPGTQHLAHAQVLFFLFDPTQHPRFRNICREISSDPQLMDSSKMSSQHLVLNEAGSRIRQWTGLSHSHKDPRPLIIVVTKYDVWGKLLRDKLPDILTLDLVMVKTKQGVTGLRLDKLEDYSKTVEEFLIKHTPEIVTAAYALSDEVIFMPVSALGTSPELRVINESTGETGFYVKSGDINPQWTELPLLYAIHKSSKRLLPGMRPKA